MHFGPPDQPSAQVKLGKPTGVTTDLEFLSLLRALCVVYCAVYNLAQG